MSRARKATLGRASRSVERPHTTVTCGSPDTFALLACGRQREIAELKKDCAPLICQIISEFTAWIIKR